MSTDRTTDLMRHRGVIITVYHYSFHYCWHAEQPSWILSFLVKNMNSILTAKPYTIMISMYISIELEHSYSLFILRIICRARCQQQQRSQRLVTAALANWRKTTIMKYSNFPFFHASSLHRTILAFIWRCTCFHLMNQSLVFTLLASVWTNSIYAICHIL